MAGEIRNEMANLRLARQKMVASLKAEIGTITKMVADVNADGLEALKLPKAEIAQYRAEIAEIREEFAGLTNGGPGPLDVSSLPGEMTLAAAADVLHCSIEDARGRLKPVDLDDPKDIARAVKVLLG